MTHRRFGLSVLLSRACFFLAIIFVRLLRCASGGISCFSFVRRSGRSFPPSSLEMATLCGSLPPCRRLSSRKIGRRETHIQKKIKAQLLDAKAKSSAKDKRGALFALKRKKMYEGEVNKLNGARMTLESQVGNRTFCAAVTPSLADWPGAIQAPSKRARYKLRAGRWKFGLMLP